MNFVSRKGAKYRQDAKGHFASFVFISASLREIKAE